jgi:hypothetical protein
MADQILFDKLVFLDRLKQAGIPADQARAHAEAMHEALREAVATKADLALLRIEIAADIAGLRTGLAALETKLTIRMGVGAVGLFAALAALKFFG